MIDTKELRRLAQAAGLNAISMQEVLEILDRLEAAGVPFEVQCRVLCGATKEIAA